MIYSKMSEYFHYFNNYNSNIFIKGIGIQNTNNKVVLNITFEMDFSSKKYTFVGICPEFKDIKLSCVHKIIPCFLHKHRFVTCHGIENNIILLELKLTPEELKILE